MKRRPKLAKKQEVQTIVFAGRVYLVKRYFTGDFRGTCRGSLSKSALFTVTDAMKSSLAIGDEIEIPFVHAEFIPALCEDLRGESREEFERDRFGTAGGVR